MTSKEEECVRIVEELNARLKAEHSEHYSVRMGVEHLRNTLESAGFLERILAAVKPKGPWPIHVSSLPESPYFDLCEMGNFNDVRLHNNGDSRYWPVAEKAMDRLVVAWLKHRGVDIIDVLDTVTADNMDAYGDHKPSKTEIALRAILDNTEAD